MNITDLPAEDQALCKIAARHWNTTPIQGEGEAAYPLIMDILGIRAGWIPESEWGIQSCEDGRHWFVIRGSLSDATSEPLYFLTAVERSWSYHEQTEA